MLGLTAPTTIFFYIHPTDMRKSIDGLSGVVQEFSGRDPIDGSLFVFCNRRRDKMKMLWWDRDGFWLFYKRLEAGTFQIPSPEHTAAAQTTLSAQQLHLILSGIDLSSVKMRKRYRSAA
jgi:transposase